MDTARRHDLDWIRIGAFALLILYHTGMYYVSWDWHVKSPFASSTLEPLMLLSSPWRMSLLFFVSGAATAFLLRKSDAGFMRTRSRRLLIPLAFGMLVVVVPQAYYEVVEKAGYADGFLAFYARYLSADGSFCTANGCLTLPTWNHLWFLPYLWCYTLLLWGWHAMAPIALERLRTRIVALMSGPGVLLWPVVPLALARVALYGPFPSTHALVDDWYNHAVFFPMFMLGCLLAHAEPVWESLGRLRWVALLTAAASYGFIVAYLATYSSTNPPPEAMRWLMRSVWGLDQWSAIAAVLGFARQWSPGDSRARRYLTQAVFPLYIVHQTATVVFAHHLKPLALRPLVEGPLLVALTFAACFASYELVRRVPWLRPLFGLGPREREAGYAMQPRASTGQTA